MMNSTDNKLDNLLPVSNLIWIGEKGDDSIQAKAIQGFMNTYFPKTQIEQLEIEEENHRKISQKIAVQFKKWSDEKILDQSGLFCKHPMGFQNWNGFIDFVRQESPAFLWKIHPAKAFAMDRILVPMDFSSGTERTFPILKNILAKSEGASITLLNLYNYEKEAENQELIASSRTEKIAEIQWFLEANLNEALRSKLIVDAIPRMGKDKSWILEQYIKNKEIDLIILGSHNFSHYHYLLYGSTSADILNNETTAQVCVLFK